MEVRYHKHDKIRKKKMHNATSYYFMSLRSCLLTMKSVKNAIYNTDNKAFSLPPVRGMRKEARYYETS